ncbi:UvrD-helicase domain-containing protein [Pseudoxanthomonas kaohsiungensis]|uniref:DNA 3'-5' helicase II n=1 Tax=Pseudoxanthomonas kaohsiungensis TaxID=283923 RepID=A0ABW3M0K4_9GAMM|nr:UvrD-helicase domain-containing protein [Pseudoxanthomonas kaohsiungensis]KAF1699908.1 hypothetical protein CSC66_16870 [Pseudoxanthomonas kaohsiungensis]
MVDAAHLGTLNRGAVVAPAGHGKTELLAQVAALGGRSLILTHTNAGVHAIRERLRRLGVPGARAAVQTIAKWCARYAYAFPGAAQPPLDDPKTAAEWQQLHLGTASALGIAAIREVVLASYDRVLVDEYQDCTPDQHVLVKRLSEIVPTIVVGDPMQGIFEFAGAKLDWPTEIHPDFPFSGTLTVPYRWAGKNPALGAWIAETRLKLEHGQPIDLADPRVSYRVSKGPFDMGLLFETLEGKDGSVAAIHCNKKICYRLASAANGGYQAIEEVAANTLMSFARQWDRAADAKERLAAVLSLSNECFHKIDFDKTQEFDPDHALARDGMKAAAKRFGDGNGGEAAGRFMALARTHPKWKLYRSSLWRDAEHAAAELTAERTECMVDAAERIKQRSSNMGRRLPRRTISTPLLLKGLEFDHVVIPDAAHFMKQDMAQAKLFYVAISRATLSLTIGSSQRWLQF